MGWYVTCDICGLTGKYAPVCDCYFEATKTNAQRMKGCLVKGSYLVDTQGAFLDLYQHLVDSEGQSLYFRTDLSNQTGEYKQHRKIKEITKKEFDEREMSSEVQIEEVEVPRALL